MSIHPLLLGSIMQLIPYFSSERGLRILPFHKCLICFSQMSYLLLSPEINIIKNPYFNESAQESLFQQISSKILILTNPLKNPYFKKSAQKSLFQQSSSKILIFNKFL